MHQITVHSVVVDVVRKDIKNLHLAVYPPHGRVRVAAPLRVDDEAVRLAVLSRWGWIRRQQRQFRAQDRQSKREYVSGESHYFQGRRYLMDVTEHDGPPAVRLRGKRMNLTVRPGSTRAQRERVLSAWYRRYLKEAVPSLIAKWEPVMGVEVADWGIRLMKTKWGTCTIEARRIWLNLELAKKPAPCLEYLVVHEMVHLLERHHNDRFTAYMDQFLPTWQHLRKLLNDAPLKHEDWDY